MVLIHATVEFSTRASPMQPSSRPGRGRLSLFSKDSRPWACSVLTLPTPKEPCHACAIAGRAADPAAQPAVLRPAAPVAHLALPAGRAPPTRAGGGIRPVVRRQDRLWPAGLRGHGFPVQ